MVQAMTGVDWGEPSMRLLRPDCEGLLAEKRPTEISQESCLRQVLLLFHLQPRNDTQVALCRSSCASMRTCSQRTARMHVPVEHARSPTAGRLCTLHLTPWRARACQTLSQKRHCFHSDAVAQNASVATMVLQALHMYQLHKFSKGLQNIDRSEVQGSRCPPSW